MLSDDGTITKKPQHLHTDDDNDKRYTSLSAPFLPSSSPITPSLTHDVTGARRNVNSSTARSPALSRSHLQ